MRLVLCLWNEMEREGRIKGNAYGKEKRLPDRTKVKMECGKDVTQISRSSQSQPTDHLQGKRGGGVKEPTHRTAKEVNHRGGRICHFNQLLLHGDRMMRQGV